MALRRSKRKILDNDKQHGPKRLARVRRHENGHLDVTPEGDYVELLEKNRRSSPLFRLPREVRDMIWKEVLGNKTIEPKDWGFRTCFATDVNYFALLHVCREIYSEAALMPYEENVFRAKRNENFLYSLSKIEIHLRKHIKQVEFGLDLVFHTSWVDQLEGLTHITLQGRYIVSNNVPRRWKIYQQRILELKEKYPNLQVRFRLESSLPTKRNWIHQYFADEGVPLDWISESKDEDQRVWITSNFM
ncbi:hypothetical protein DM02DRAFT_695627 [Periconia macrospinosa]|uniref:2EXR domain-containing protein n=1 Tax=Periconia macrospinosa TaxID=97972 RepID=A0A2V1D7J3_9PLEO|nr:hypothetical protein DM02DRAFT_695627 [Periconia macrospinosa]